MTKHHNVRIHAVKKDGTEVRGTAYDDGLASLLAVTCDDGETRYVSVLDRVVSREQFAPSGPYAIAADARW